MGHLKGQICLTKKKKSKPVSIGNECSPREEILVLGGGRHSKKLHMHERWKIKKEIKNIRVSTLPKKTRVGLPARPLCSHEQPWGSHRGV